MRIGTGLAVLSWLWMRGRGICPSGFGHSDEEMFDGDSSDGPARNAIDILSAPMALERRPGKFCEDGLRTVPTGCERLSSDRLA